MAKAGDAKDRTSGAGAKLSQKGQDLIQMAGVHKLGVDFLVEGHPESVAVIHGVHPFVVQEVRDYLNRKRKGLR